MKGTTIADTAIANAEVLYEMIEELRANNQNLQTENQLLKALLENIIRKGGQDNIHNIDEKSFQGDKN